MSNTRAKKFIGLVDHPWYSKLVKRLSQSEREFILEFCKQHEGIDSGAFATAADRACMGLPPSRNLTLVSELLLILR